MCAHRIYSIQPVVNKQPKHRDQRERGSPKTSPCPAAHRSSLAFLPEPISTRKGGFGETFLIPRSVSKGLLKLAAFLQQLANARHSCETRGRSDKISEYFVFSFVLLGKAPTFWRGGVVICYGCFCSQ